MQPVASKRFPVGAPDIGPLEEANVIDAIRSTWVSSTGPYLDEFESRFAEICGVGYAISCANGTVALHLALAGLGIGAGDEVIVPSLTYVATANAVTYTGATPVFCDVSRDSWCLDPVDVLSRLTSRTKAIIAVHLYGQPADTELLSQIAQDAGVALIEDAAEAPFATVGGRAVGGLGTVAAFSFYGNKILTSGEGGAVTTSDPHLAAKMRLLRGQGMDPERRYFFPVVGYNYRLTNLSAAILCAQLDRAAEMLEKRRNVFSAYESVLGSIGEFELQKHIQGSTRSPWMFSLLLQGELADRRDDLSAVLAVLGVDTRPFFYPLHRLPPYEPLGSRDLKVTDDLAHRGISLPTSSTMSIDDALEVADRIMHALESL